MTEATVTASTPVRGTENLERLAAGTLMIGFTGRSVPEGTRELIARGVRSFILFARNIGDADAVKSLTAELRDLAGTDALIASDHEGGRVNRLGGAVSPWPSPMAWAATGSLDLIRRASHLAAQELRALGINLNFAPVADILSDHTNPVLGIRCFSDDPATAAACTTAFVEGHRMAHVASTAKHFPGHGGTGVDSHVDLPRVDLDLSALRRADLVPFQAAIAAGVDCLMRSHVWYSTLDEHMTPATLSSNVTALARRDLGYEGVLLTDCLEMGAIQRIMSSSEATVRSVAAGTDMAIVSHRLDLQHEALDALMEAARNGSIPVEHLRAANRRLDALRSRVRVEDISHPVGGENLARSIAGHAVVLVRDEERAIPLRLERDEPLGIITFASAPASGAENPEVLANRLAEAAHSYHPHIVAASASEDGTPDSVLDALRGVDTVLVGTSFTTGRPLQRLVIEAVLASGKRLVVLALSDPFDLLAIPQVPCYLATLGDLPVQLDAALGVVFGRRTAQGHLPVTLGDLYPRGHGLP